LKKVIEQTKDNPVFYVQYAYARCHSIKRHVQELFPKLDLSASTLAKISYDDLEVGEFLSLMKKLAAWPRTIEMAAKMYEPHRITYYLSELAAEFHALWTKGKDKHHLRFIDTENQALTQKHFALIAGIVTVIGAGLSILGVTPREEM